MISRRRFIIAAAGAGVSAAGLVYIRKIEPAWLRVSRMPLSLPAGKWQGAPLRVLHLTDLHFSRAVPLGLIEAAIARGLAEKPDLICVTGDFVTYNEDYDASVYAPVLARLSAAAPTFAVLGNHDSRVINRFAVLPHRVSELLRHAGLTLLHNRNQTLTVHGRRVHLAGVGDWWMRECLPSEAFRNLTPAPNEPVLALCHNPDAKETLRPHPWDALLCGHTHGGQCGLPFINAALAPVRDKRFLGGAYRYADRWLHISRGVGNLHGVRLFCRPEINVLEFA